MTEWNLITFAPGHDTLSKIKSDMPLMNNLRVQVARSFYKTLNTDLGQSYEDWAIEAIQRAMMAGFNVRAAFVDHGPTDYPTLPESIVEILHGVKCSYFKGVTLDAEWENERISGPGGWQTWHQGYVPVIQAIRNEHPDVLIAGPGGTHSDEHTLIPLLDAIKASEAEPDIFTAHIYYDQGWDNANKRLSMLRRVAGNYGYKKFSITETGVTGEDSVSKCLSLFGRTVYNDDLKGTEDENFDARFSRMKEFWDGQSSVDWVDIYQFTEDGGTADEHGSNFGMYKANGDPKACTRHWMTDGEQWWHDIVMSLQNN